MLEKGEEMWYNITEGKRSDGGERKSVANLMR